MTFDSVSFQSPLAELPLSQSESRADNAFEASQKTKFFKQESSNEHSENNKVSNREDESGTHSDRSGGLHRDSRLENISLVTAHLESAEAHMHAELYESAYDELEAAANIHMANKMKLNHSLNNYIAHLTTLGCRATPPHPVALPLVRLRRKLTA
jgi:hypothetical protein